MTADQKSLAKTFGAIAAGIIAVGIITQQTLVVTPAPRSITLGWTNATNNATGTVTEIWSSTNLVNWTLKTNVAGTNHVTLPATNRAEFFKIRSRDTNGTVSDWARKPTL